MKHTIPPIFDRSSQILILGSFPSVKSREIGFYYSHQQNRFWRLISEIIHCDLPQTASEKKELLMAHGIALWDVIGSCDVIGSSDSSIKNVIPNDIPTVILNECDIKHIFLNGGTAGKLFGRYFPQIEIQHTILPSTSPANASFSFQTLTKAWSVIEDYIPHDSVNKM